MLDRTLSLFQLCDSNFPTGAFSHSFGLESYIQENIVYDQETFSEWLKVYLNEQLVYSDGLATRLVYESLENGDIEKVWKIDRMLMVQNLPREIRDGYTENGRTDVKSCGIFISKLHYSHNIGNESGRSNPLGIRPLCLR